MFVVGKRTWTRVVFDERNFQNGQRPTVQLILPPCRGEVVLGKNSDKMMINCSQKFGSA
jgi:hypothetical protein